MAQRRDSDGSAPSPLARWRAGSPVGHEDGGSTENEWESVGYSTPSGSESLRPAAAPDLPDLVEIALPPPAQDAEAAAAAAVAAGPTRSLLAVEQNAERKIGPDKGALALAAGSMAGEPRFSMPEHDPALAVDRLFDRLLERKRARGALALSSGVIQQRSELNFLFEFFKRLGDHPNLQLTILERLAALVDANEANLAACHGENLFDRLLVGLFKDGDELLRLDRLKPAVRERLLRFLVVLGTHSFSHNALVCLFSPLRRWHSGGRGNKFQALLAIDTMRSILASCALTGSPREYIRFTPGQLESQGLVVSNGEGVARSIGSFPKEGVTFGIWFRVEPDLPEGPLRRGSGAASASRSAGPPSPSCESTSFDDILRHELHGAARAGGPSAAAAAAAAENIAALLCLRNAKDGAGIELLLSGSQHCLHEDGSIVTVRDLIVRCYSAANVTTSKQVPGVRLASSSSARLGGWHWLCMSLSGSAFMRRPRLQLYIDGDSILDTNFSYPQSPHLAPAGASTIAAGAAGPGAFVVAESARPLESQSAHPERPAAAADAVPDHDAAAAADAETSPGPANLCAVGAAFELRALDTADDGEKGQRASQGLKWGFNGQIARVVLLSTALSPAEVLKLYDLHTRHDGSALLRPQALEPLRVSAAVSSGDAGQGAALHDVSSAEHVCSSVPEDLYHGQFGGTQKSWDQLRFAERRKQSWRLSSESWHHLPPSLYDDLVLAWDAKHAFEEHGHWMLFDSGPRGHCASLQSDASSPPPPPPPPPLAPGAATSPAASLGRAGEAWTAGPWVRNARRRPRMLLSRATHVVERQSLREHLAAIDGTQRLLPLLLECVHEHNGAHGNAVDQADCSARAALAARIIALQADLLSIEFCQGRQRRAGARGDEYWIGAGVKNVGLIHDVLLRACPNSLTVEVVMAVASLADTAASLAGVHCEEVLLARSPAASPTGAAGQRRPSLHTGSPARPANASSASSAATTTAATGLAVEDATQQSRLAIAATKLLFDLGIWANAPAFVQNTVFQVLHHHLRVRFAFVRRHVGVQTLLDHLRLSFYLRSPAQDSAGAQAPRRRPCQPPLADEDLRRCRLGVLGLIDVMICGGTVVPGLAPFLRSPLADSSATAADPIIEAEPEPVDFGHVAYLLKFCQAQRADVEQLPDVLRFIVSLVARARGGALPGLLAHIQDQGNLLPLWPLLATQGNDEVRLWTLRLIHVYTLRTGNSTSPRTATGPFEVGDALSGKFALEIAHTTHLSALLARGPPLSAACADALVAFMIGADFDESGRTQERPSTTTSRKVRFPLIARVLLESLCAPDTPSEVRLRALDQLSYVMAEPGLFNWHMMTRVKAWQHWLAKLASDADPAVRSLVADLLCGGLFHRMLGGSGAHGEGASSFASTSGPSSVETRAAPAAAGDSEARAPESKTTAVEVGSPQAPMSLSEATSPKTFATALSSTTSQWIQGMTGKSGDNGPGAHRARAQRPGSPPPQLQAPPAAPRRRESESEALYEEGQRDRELGIMLAHIDFAMHEDPHCATALRRAVLGRLVARVVQLLRDALAGSDVASAAVARAQKQLDHLALVACEESLGGIATGAGNEQGPSIGDSELAASTILLLSRMVAFCGDEGGRPVRLVGLPLLAAHGKSKADIAACVARERDARAALLEDLARRRAEWGRCLRRCGVQLLEEGVAKASTRAQRLPLAFEALAEEGKEENSGARPAAERGLKDSEIEQIARAAPKPVASTLWQVIRLVVLDLEERLASGQDTRTAFLGLDEQVQLLDSLLARCGLLAVASNLEDRPRAPFHRRRSSFESPRSQVGSPSSRVVVLETPQVGPASKSPSTLKTMLGSPFMVPGNAAPLTKMPSLTLPSNAAAEQRGGSGRSLNNATPLRRRPSASHDAFVLVDEPESMLSNTDLEHLVVLLARLGECACNVGARRDLRASLLGLAAKICAEIACSDVMLDVGLTELVRGEWIQEAEAEAEPGPGPAAQPGPRAVGRLIPEEWTRSGQLRRLRTRLDLEDDVFHACGLLHREAGMRCLKRDLKAFQDARAQAARRLETQARNKSLNQYQEEARRSTILHTIKEQDQEAFRRWRLLLRTGALHPISAFKCISRKMVQVVLAASVWKLDRRESEQRMRLRLKRGYGEYVASGHGMDAEGFNSANSSPALRPVSARADDEPMRCITKTLSELALSRMAGDPGQRGEHAHDDVADATTNNGESRTASEGASNGGAAAAAPALEHGAIDSDEASGEGASNPSGSFRNANCASSADWDVVELTSVHYAARNEQVVHSTECELILPMCVVVGRMDLTASHIYFYGDYVAPPGHSTDDSVQDRSIRSRRRLSRRATSTEEAQRRSANGEAGGGSQRPRSGLDELWTPQLDANEAKLRPRRWALCDLCDIHQRRYLLQPSALELFFANAKNYMFNFRGDKENKLVSERILQQKPAMLVGASEAPPLRAGMARPHSFRKLLSPDRLVKQRQEAWTEKWVNWEMTTFEYLMHLNTAAGRTYNDLTQYPVFPWILSDYSSATIDLQDPAVYRDLRKPVGALEPARLKRFRERIKTCRELNERPFLYGTHYSSVGTVLYFMLRVEPFATYAKEMQGGRFDHADRLFHSVQETWANCLSADSDVKELVPEWFYFGNLFRNANGLDLGERQDGTKLRDVELPPWAEGSPERFVRTNMEALEGDIASSSIHHWIDLIFGFKQRGVEAERADNLFHYLTYEDEVDLNSIADPVMRRAFEAQIAHFGQTPAQLFARPHPCRRPRPRPMSARPTVLLKARGRLDLPKDLVVGELPRTILFAPQPPREVLAARNRLFATALAAGDLALVGNESSPTAPSRVGAKGGAGTPGHGAAPSPSSEVSKTKRGQLSPESGTEATLDAFDVLFDGRVLHLQVQRVGKGAAQLVGTSQTLLRSQWPYQRPGHLLQPAAWAASPAVFGAASAHSWVDHFGSDSQIVSLANGTAFASSGHVDDTIKVHSTLDGRLLQSVCLPPGCGGVTCISADGASSALVAGTQSGSILVWDLSESAEAEKTVRNVASVNTSEGTDKLVLQVGDAEAEAVSGMPRSETYGNGFTSGSDSGDEAEDGRPGPALHRSTSTPEVSKAKSLGQRTALFMMNKLWSAFGGKKREHAPIVADRSGPRHWFAGLHSGPVASAFISTELDLAGSCAMHDRNIALHTLSDGRFLRTLQLPWDGAVDQRSVLSLRATKLGHILAQDVRAGASAGSEEWCLHVLHVNGGYLGHTVLREPVIQLAPFRDAKHLLVATASSVSIFDVDTLQRVAVVEQSAAGEENIVSVQVAGDEGSLAVLRASGSLVWFAISL